MILSTAGPVEVSDCDFNYILGISGLWGDNGGYPSITRNGKQIKLHKVVAERMGLIGKVDHEDRNKLNCRRENIRLATYSQNGANRNRLPNNSTGFKGVCWSKDHGKFRTEIRVNWKPIFLGYFYLAEEAAKVYDRAALEFFGEFACTNFPRSDYANPISST